MSANPYVGLRPFEAADRAQFFGRDTDAARLQNALFAHPLTVLYAVSGTGKSSVVRTLVIPYLQSTGATVVEVSDWPGDRAPLDTVRAALGAPDVALDAALAARDGETVLVLDQFEELLTHEARREGVRALMRAFAQLARRAPDAFVLIAIREEQIGRLRAFAGRYADVLRNTYAMGHLEGDGVRAAIARPAQDAGRPMEPALVARLQADLSPNGAPVELPLLQVVCRWLWHVSEGDARIRLAQYTAAGGREGVIEAWLDATLGAFGGPRDAVAAVLDFLAPQSGYKQAYSVDELVAQTRDRSPAPTPAAIRASLAHLRAADVVHAVDQGGTERYQLRHDAFIGLLQGWLEAAREERLSRRARRLRLWTVGLVVVGVVLILGALQLNRQRLEIDRQGEQIGAQRVKIGKQQAELGKREADLRTQRELLDQRRAQLEALRESEVECLLDDVECSDALIDAWTPDQLEWVWGFIETKYPADSALAGLHALQPRSDRAIDVYLSTEARRMFARAHLERLRGGWLALSLRPDALRPDAAFFEQVQSGAIWTDPEQDADVAFAAGQYALVRGRPVRAAALFAAGARFEQPRFALAQGYALLRAIEDEPAFNAKKRAVQAFELLSGDPKATPLHQALAGYAGALALDRGARVSKNVAARLQTVVDQLREDQPAHARLVSLLHARAQLAAAAAPGGASKEMVKRLAEAHEALEALAAPVAKADLGTLFGSARQMAHRSEEALVLGRLLRTQALLLRGARREEAILDAEVAVGLSIQSLATASVRTEFARVFTDQARFSDAQAQLRQAIEDDRAHGPAYVQRAVIQLWGPRRALAQARETAAAACAYADAYTCHLIEAVMAADASDWARAADALALAEHVGPSQRALWTAAGDARLIDWIETRTRPSAAMLARLCPGLPRCP